MAISRDEVLHVARLARLALTDEEVERLTEELGAILDAVGVVAELDLADVPPTSIRSTSSTSGTRTSRAPRSRSTTSSRTLRIARATTSAFRRWRVIDTLRLTAEGAMGLVERREVRPPSSTLPISSDRRARRRAPLLPAHVRRAERRGIPIALKDVISTKGIETTAGSKILSGLHAGLRLDRRRAREGGGPLGARKDEYGRVRDGLLDRELRLGAVAQPLGSVARSGRIGRRHRGRRLGRPRAVGARSDTGGSIKQPSALCGNVGLRPTYGTVSRYGIVAFASSLDQIGPVAKTVRDVALLYSIIAGRDPLDSTTAELPEAVQLPESDSLAGVRLAVPKQVAGWMRSSLVSAPRSRVARARARAGRRGGGVRPPALVPLRDAVLLPRRSGRGVVEPRALRRRAVRAAHEGETYDDMVERTRDDGFGAEPKRRIMLGTYALSAGYYDAYYGQAQRVRTLLIREHREALEGFDAIVTPTSPTVAFPVGDKAADPLAMYACDLLTIPSCLAGLPGLSIPCGLSDGLPVGLQLIGPQFGENGLFRIGHALEQSLGFDSVPERLR